MASLNRSLFLFLIILALIYLESCTSCSSSGRRKKKLNKANTEVLKPNLITQMEMKPEVKCRLQEGKYYDVLKEVDGDTFWLDNECDGVKIRLIGIDAPESINAFRHIRIEPFGKEATEYMSFLIRGNRVRVEFDTDSLDQYGRTLAYCFTEQGIFLNKEIVAQGLAEIEIISPNVKYKDVFLLSQKNAQKREINLWSK